MKDLEAAENEAAAEGASVISDSWVDPELPGGQLGVRPQRDCDNGGRWR